MYAWLKIAGSLPVLVSGVDCRQQSVPREPGCGAMPISIIPEASFDGLPLSWSSAVSSSREDVRKAPSKTTAQHTR